MASGLPSQCTALSGRSIRRPASHEELTYNRKIHSSPCWSPDGKWIVYTADDNWNSIQLEIVNVSSGEIRKLTDDQPGVCGPGVLARRQAIRLRHHAAKWLLECVRASDSERRLGRSGNGRHPGSSLRKTAALLCGLGFSHAAGMAERWQRPRAGGESRRASRLRAFYGACRSSRMRWPRPGLC